MFTWITTTLTLSTYSTFPLCLTLMYFYPVLIIILFLTSNEVTITMNNSETGKEAERTPCPPLWALSSNGASVLIHQ